MGGTPPLENVCISIIYYLLVQHYEIRFDPILLFLLVITTFRTMQVMFDLRNEEKIEDSSNECLTIPQKKNIFTFYVFCCSFSDIHTHTQTQIQINKQVQQSKIYNNYLIKPQTFPFVLLLRQLLLSLLS